jgi:hypothetical protein
MNRAAKGLGTISAIALISVASGCASTKPPAPAASAAANPASPRTEAPLFHRPYREDALNVLYNLLFGDDVALLRAKAPTPAPGALEVLLSPNPRTEDVERIADDANEESRARLVAFNVLRSKNAKIAPGLVLGVVVEVALPGGLDTLAVFADGRMRYFNHSGKVGLFEATPAAMEEARRNLMQAGSAAVSKIGPSDRPRQPPPAPGNLRLTFLASDGLHFGEGPFSVMEHDPTGGPVFQAATELLMKIVNATTK